MKKLKNIIIHCSDSEWGCASEIRRWHLEKGWKDIGYHFVILNGLILPDTSYQTKLNLSILDGSIEVGRRLDGDLFIDDSEVGAHALGYNSNSLGICLIGRDRFSNSQFYKLMELIKSLQKQYGIISGNIMGHRDVCPGRDCPGFEVKTFLKNYGIK